MTGHEPLILALAAVLGLLVGSFLNVCIWRLPRRESVVSPGSYCPACERRLTWWEMAPLLSYLALGGRCRTCRARISPVYPTVEAANATIYVAALLIWGWSLHALGVAIFGSLLLVGGMIDGRHRIIPDVITIPGLVAGLVLSTLNPAIGFWGSLAGLALGGGFLLLVAVVTNGGMGGGDIKLAAMMGAFLGWSSLIAGLLFGFITGALFGGTLVLLGVKHRKDLMAFGPFLAAGGLAAAFWGPDVVAWYLRVLWG
jgi:leader peptidase (prepilin peptidase)/N-methyltransferase